MDASNEHSQAFHSFVALEHGQWLLRFIPLLRQTSIRTAERLKETGSILFLLEYNIAFVP